MAEFIRTRIEGGVFEVTLDRPKANAIDLQTSRKMGDVFQAFRDDSSLKVGILRTAGEKFFSAGWDLKAAAAGDSVTADYGVGGFGGLLETCGHLGPPRVATICTCSKCNRKSISSHLKLILLSFDLAILFIFTIDPAFEITLHRFSNDSIKSY